MIMQKFDLIHDKYMNELVKLHDYVMAGRNSQRIVKEGLFSGGLHGAKFANYFGV